MELRAWQLAASGHDFLLGRDDGQPDPLEQLVFDAIAAAERLATEAQQGKAAATPARRLCADLKQDYEVDARVAARALRSAAEDELRGSKDPELRKHLNHFTTAQSNLAAALNPTTACLDMEGAYSGHCYSSNGVVPISFAVIASGGQCTVQPFLFFQGAAMSVSQGSAAATLPGNPGVPARASLVIHGAGSFTMSGNAGPTPFSCY